MSTARSTLREDLALKMRTRGVTGTATGGSTVAVADTGRDEETKFWNKAWVTVKDTSNTATETIETREINEFTSGVSGGTGQMDVLRAFSFTVAAGDTYELHKRFSVDELNDAINEAIRRTKGKILTKTSATTTSSANTYAYELASGAEKVFDVRLQADSGTATYPYYKMLKWRIRPGTDPPVLQFNQAIDGGYTIRYYYTADATELTSDTATTDLALDYIYAAARAECYNYLAADAKDDNEFRRYMTKSDDFNREARALLRYYSTQPPAKRVLKETEWLGGEGWYEVTYEKQGLA